MRLLFGVATILFLPALVAVALLVGSDSPRTEAAPLHGAIFTTTPDGGIVNENVRYEQKIEVYLDGGPPQNAPQTAAGLPDGDYVFQVTDPSGKVLLSEDASVCRVLRVEEGVIVALRDEDSPFIDHTASDSCHINDDPEGAAGASGQHDTNVDVDHGAGGAIVVQLMPFFDTPNPGGVYKAWIIPLSRYLDNGGDLDETPDPACERRGRAARSCNGKSTVQIGFVRDGGFGPPRDQVKTDNFKVREFFPPEITVRKFHDINADGVWDQDTEPEIGQNGQLGVPGGTICVEADGTIDADCNTGGGWSYGFIEPADGGPIGSYPHFTPKTHVAGIPGTYNATEDVLPGWEQSAAYLDGAFLGVQQSVDIVVAGNSGETHEVIFGNFRPGDVHGTKFIDLDADGVRDGGEACPAAPDPNNAGCEGITIHLVGTDGMGQSVDRHTTTDANGDFWFMGVKPGSYIVCEELSAEFIQSFPSSGPDCSGHSPNDGGIVRDVGHAVMLTSGEVSEDNDFGNFSLAEVHGLKFFDHDGNGMRDQGDEGIAGVEIHLFGTDGMGQAVHVHTSTDSNGEFWFMDLVPGDYSVCEEPPAGSGLFETLPSSGADCSAHPAAIGGTVQRHGYAVSLESDQKCENKDFGNFGPCDGLTPGYWSNWRNHYTDAQFLILLQGTVASSIAEADEFFESLGCDNGDAAHCMRRFLLANQLTLNLTQHPELPNPGDAGLVGLCSIPGIGTLQDAIQEALDILANPGNFTRDQILAVKNKLAAFAELNG